MAQLASTSVDLVLTDPPYGSTSFDWDAIARAWIGTAWLNEVSRLLKPTGCLWVWGTFRYLLRFAGLAAAQGWKVGQDLVWEKNNGSGFAADKFRCVHQLVVQFYFGSWSTVYKAPQFEPTGRTGVVSRAATAAGVHGARQAHTTRLDRRLLRSVQYEKQRRGAGHPTAKPFGISESIVRYSCPPGGLVLDPYAGSGTTGAAALRCGCSCVLIERDERYVSLARTTLESIEREGPNEQEPTNEA